MVFACIIPFAPILVRDCMLGQSLEERSRTYLLGFGEQESSFASSPGRFGSGVAAFQRRYYHIEKTRSSLSRIVRLEQCRWPIKNLWNEWTARSLFLSSSLSIYLCIQPIAIIKKLCRKYTHTHWLSSFLRVAVSITCPNCTRSRWAAASLLLFVLVTKEGKIATPKKTTTRKFALVAWFGNIGYWYVLLSRPIIVFSPTSWTSISAVSPLQISGRPFIHFFSLVTLSHDSTL